MKRLLWLAPLALIATRFTPVSFRAETVDAVKPFRATGGAAGYDISTPVSGSIEPGETQVIDLGWSVACLPGYYISLQTRSSLSIKRGIVLANGTEGVVDSDYRDTVRLALRNTGSETFYYEAGDRIAQLLIKKYSLGIPTPRWFIDLFKASRRKGGLGSTGLNC